MQRPPPLELPPVRITAEAPPGMTVLTTQSKPRGSGMFGNGTNAQLQQVETSVKTQELKRTVKHDFETRSQKVAESLEVEISAHRSHTAHLPYSQVEAWQREVNIRNALLASKTAQLQHQTHIANAFFGSDPRDKSFADFVQKAKTIDKMIWPGSHATQLWEQSYRAAHEVQLLTQSIALLHQQSAAAHTHLRAAQVEAQRVAAEQARIAAEQQRQREIAETARRQKEQDEIEAQKRKDVAELAEARRLAAELAARRRAEKARLKRLQDAEAKAQRQRPTFAHAGTIAAFGPAFTGPTGTVAVNPATSLALRSALLTAVSAATAAATAVSTPVLVGFAALLAPSSLGNGDLYSVSVPLSELASIPTTELHERATTGQEIDLPVTLGWRTIGNRAEIVVAATNGGTIPSNVPVKLAHFDTRKNAYVSGTGIANGPLITWTPQAEPLSPSTDFPSVDNDPTVYEGATVTPITGRIDPNPRLDLYGFGGQITVFPIDSGLPPIFTLFRDRRQDPGVASGIGQPVSGDWLDAASTPEGAPIPKQIADKLRGREFSSFRAFRRAFWKAMGDDIYLSGQFTKLRQVDMKQRLAPVAHPLEQVGRRKKYEIHHIEFISEGGDVYDMDNLRLMTPKSHISLHSKTQEN